MKLLDIPGTIIEIPFSIVEKMINEKPERFKNMPNWHVFYKNASHGYGVHSMSATNEEVYKMMSILKEKGFNTFYQCGHTDDDNKRGYKFVEIWNIRDEYVKAMNEFIEFCEDNKIKF